MKQANNINYPGRIHKFTFNSEQEVRDQNGVPTNVEFKDGELISPSSGSSVLKYTRLFSRAGSRSYRIRIYYSGITKVDDRSLLDTRSNGYALGFQLVIDGGTSNVIFSLGSGTIYVNGSSVSTTLSIGWNDIVCMNSSIQYQVSIAGNPGTVFSAHDIKFDIFEIYNRALTAAEVHNLYHGLDNVELPLVKRYGGVVGVFDVGSGLTFSDINVGKNHILKFSVHNLTTRLSPLTGSGRNQSESIVIDANGDFYYIQVQGGIVKVNNLFNDLDLFGNNYDLVLTRIGLSVTVEYLGKTQTGTLLVDEDFYIGKIGYRIGKYTIGGLCCVNLNNQAIYPLNGHAINSIDGVAATNNGATFAKTDYEPPSTLIARTKPAYKLATGEWILDPGPDYELPAGATAYPNGGGYLDSLKEKTLLDFDSTRGVLEDRMVGSLVEGEKVTNGGFDSDTGWVKQDPSWTIANGKASCDGTQTILANIYQSGVLSIGRSYRITYELTILAGSIRPAGSSTNAFSGIVRTQSGTYTEDFINLSASSILGFGGFSDFVGSIDNISIQEIRPELLPTNITLPKIGNNYSASLDERTSELRFGDIGKAKTANFIFKWDGKDQFNILSLNASDTVSIASGVLSHYGTKCYINGLETTTPIKGWNYVSVISTERNANDAGIALDGDADMNFFARDVGSLTLQETGTNDASVVGGVVGVFDGAQYQRISIPEIVLNNNEEWTVEISYNITSFAQWRTLLGNYSSYATRIMVGATGDTYITDENTQVLLTATSVENSINKMVISSNGTGDISISLNGVAETLSFQSSSSFIFNVIGNDASTAHANEGYISDVNLNNQAIYPLNGNTYNSIDGTEATNNGVTFAPVTDYTTQSTQDALDLGYWQNDAGLQVINKSLNTTGLANTTGWTEHEGEKMHNFINSYVDLQPSDAAMALETDIPRTLVIGGGSPTINGDVIDFANEVSYVQQQPYWEIGRTYMVECEVTNYSGTGDIRLPYDYLVLSKVVSSNGVYAYFVTPTTVNMRVYSFAGHTATVEIKSVKQIPSIYEIFNKANKTIYNDLARLTNYFPTNPFLWHPDDLLKVQEYLTSLYKKYMTFYVETTEENGVALSIDNMDVHTRFDYFMGLIAKVMITESELSLEEHTRWWTENIKHIE